jgi:hypothetical protein
VCFYKGFKIRKGGFVMSMDLVILERQAKKAQMRVDYWIGKRSYPETLKTLTSGNEKKLPWGGSYAFLLGEFLEAEEETMLQTAVGAIAGASYFLHLDHHMDHDPKRESAYISPFLFWPAMSLLQAKMISVFLSVLPHGLSSSFWSYHEKYMDEWTWSQKQQFNGNANDEAIVIGHSAPLKLLGAVLALACGKKDRIPDIENGLAHFILGFQVFDDILDYPTDVRSYFSTRCGNLRKRPKAFRLAKEMLAEARENFEEAGRIFGGCFTKYIDDLLKNEGILLALLDSYSKPVPKKKLVEIIKSIDLSY